VKKIESPKL